MEAIAASIDISPPPHLSTACHGPRNTPSTRIAVPFEANILALREDSQLLVVVSLDWFFTSPDMRRRILDRCAGRLSESNLIIAASHTHTSPSTDATKVGFSEVDQGYVSSVELGIAQRIEQLLDRSEWSAVQLRYATAPCDCSIERRRRVWWPGKDGFRRRIVAYPNPDGPRDMNLRLLRVEREDRSLLAVLWGISCHPNEWPRIRELSADYPGIVREALREPTGYQLPVLFLQGFCGDLRPPALGRWPLRGSWRIRVAMFLCGLINGPHFAGFSPDQYERWTGLIVQSMYHALAEAANREPLSGELANWRRTMPLSRIGLSAKIDEIVFQVFEIGRQLRFVCVSAEITWPYAVMIKESNPAATVWPVGYIDAVFGYLPTQSMLAEGGYEVTGFRSLFGVKGEFHADLEESIRSFLLADPASGTQQSVSSKETLAG
jgi:hypothetical protein